MPDPASTLTLRNNRLLLAIYLLLSLVAFVSAAGFVILGLAALFPFSLSNLVTAVVCILVGVVSGALGATLWRWIIRMARNSVRLAPDGVWFSLSPPQAKAPKLEVHFPWDQIRGVTRQRQGSVMLFALVGADGVLFTFTPLTFLRPKHVARLIAARAGTDLVKA